MGSGGSHPQEEPRPPQGPQQQAAAPTHRARVREPPEEEEEASGEDGPSAPSAAAAAWECSRFDPTDRGGDGRRPSPDPLTVDNLSPGGYALPSRAGSSTRGTTEEEAGDARCATEDGLHSLHGVKLDGSQYFRLPHDSPLRVLVGVAEVTDRLFEPNEELACEIRLYPPRNALLAALFPESSYVGMKTTAAMRGEVTGESGKACWLFDEELAFEGDAVLEERRADGALQAQILLGRPTGEKLASTALFMVPTDSERSEPLWTRAVFTKRVGQVSVAAGWVGPELVGWLAGEVLRRAAFGKWGWVATALRSMRPAELRGLVGENADEEGRSVLLYATMSAAVEPGAAEAVQLLLGAKVDPGLADAEGLTALHYAAFAGSEHPLQALLRVAANPNAVAAGGVTPLMLAGLAGSASAIQALLDSGAAAECVDSNGLTAACWVCLGCGEPPSRSGRQQLLNNGPEEARAVARISRGLHEGIDRRRSRSMELWGGPDRRELLGLLTERLYRARPLSKASSAAIRQLWLPLVREAARPGPVRCGCFSELYSQLQRLQGLGIPVLSSVFYAAVADGDASGEQLCRMLLRECGELPISGSLPDGRTLTEAALDLGWDDVAIMLCDRGAVLDSDCHGQARALRTAVESGRKELAKRLVAQWAQARDAWSRPSLPAAEGLAECPVCFCTLCESAGALFAEEGRRACQHLVCLTCAGELAKQSQAPKCPICRVPFKPPAQRLPDPREDPGGWFAFFDETGSGYLDRHLLEKVLPAVVPVDAGRLEASLRGQLWAEWDPAGEGRISRAAFCAERGLLRWLAEHLAELQEDKARGPPPKLEQDRKGWFRHWARPGAMEMGRGEVLRAVLKSAGTSSLEAAAVAAWREWIERCWLMWDRDGNGKISLSDFCAEGGLADMMLQQSGLAHAKRIVRRMELEPHDCAALVACCQQLVECAVGVLPEDPVSRWPGKAHRKLLERAASPNREDYEAALRDGASQVVLAMRRNPGNAKLFAWGCRAIAALSFAPQDEGREPDGPQQALDSLLAPRAASSSCGRGKVAGVSSAEAPVDHLRDPPLWRLVIQGFVGLLPDHEGACTLAGGPCQATAAHGLAAAPAPGALREAGLCAVGALRVLVDRAGPKVGDEVCATLATILGGRGGGACGSPETSGDPLLAGGPLTSLAAWVQNALGLDGRGAPSAELLAWVAAASAALAADGRKLAGMLLTAAPTPQFAPSVSGLLAAFGEGLACRPPTTRKQAARLVQALLAGLHKLPAGARAGAGGGGACAGGAGGEGPPRTRIRDGRIAVGDAVRLHPDLTKAKREQEPAEHFGGWCDRMAFCLDYPGRVVEIPRRAPRMPEVLRISHGAMGCWCWNVNVVAEVVSDAGLLPFEEGECGPGVALAIGDEVRIAASVEDARKLQVNHGGWNDRMAYCCSRVGRLEAIDKAGDMKVLVPGVGAFVWNPAALRAPHAQRWEAALCERIVGPLGGTLPVAILAALTALGGRLDEAALRAALREAQGDAIGSGGGTCSAAWASLVAAALVIDPARASGFIEEKGSVTLGSASRLDALQVAAKELEGPGAGISIPLQEDLGLWQALEDWWGSLPASEKRARGI